MLFAAGFGTRMGALTAQQPKPLIRVAGRALIDHALALVDDFGPLRRVVNTHYRSNQLAAHLAGRDVTLSDEQPQILDTGGGLRAALPVLGSAPVFTLNTDAVWSGPNPLRLLGDAWDPARMEALLLCIPLANAIGRKGGGDFSHDANGQVQRGGDLVYTGAQIIQTDGLAAIPDAAFSLNVLWNAMADRGGLNIVTYPGQWCDVGHPDGIQLAEAMLADRDV